MRRGSKLNRLMDYWVGAPALNLLATLHRRSKPPARINRLGVMCSPALGDTLLFSGPLQDLRKGLPSAHIVHLCMKPNLAAAEIIAGADERLLVHLSSPWKTRAAIRAQKFDAVLDFTSWQRLTAFYTLTSGAPYTVGFLTPGMYRSRGYDRVVQHTAARHELENFRALVNECGLIPPVERPSQPAVIVSPVAEEPFASERDVVVFHPWASGQNSWLREWPEERWLNLAEALRRDNTLFVITGGPADAPRVKPLVSLLHRASLRAEAFVSPDGFRSLTHLLLRARVVVSVNTGVMHLAAVAGAPTVSLNGPTAEHRWGARGRCVENVQPADGSGGYLHLGFEFAGQPEDIMQRIPVDSVVRACERLQHCAGQAR